MKLALVPLERWEQLNQELKTHYAMSPDTSLRIFKGMAHAVFEIVHGTAQFLSHKRNLGVVKGQTPYFEPLLSAFYKEAYGIQAVTYEQLVANSEADEETQNKSIALWVEGLKKDTNFVLFAEDHPVTGQLYAWQKLDELLNEKKVYALRVSHFHHFYDTSALRPYSVQICALSRDLAIAKCGDRFRVPPLIAPFMNWEEESILQSVRKIHVPLQDKAQVLEFENSFPGLATPWLSPSLPRLYDRVLLKFADISGDALLGSLQKKLSLTGDPQHFAQTLETTDLCRWHHYKSFSSWWEPKPSEDDLQGLLVIDSGWLVTKDFGKILRQTCEEIRAQQSW